MSSLITLNTLHKSFGPLSVLDGISLTLNTQESLGIIGGSGSGKSVLLKCILGLLRPDHGTIQFLDSTPVKYAKNKCPFLTGMLFQGGALFDSLKIWENIAFNLIYRQKIDRVTARKKAIEKLDAVDLPNRVADQYPEELSGGMQKRVALARAIANDPKLIFFDEPTTGLDPIVSATINQLIVRCVKEIGASAITITHDIHSLRCIADRVGLLFKGKLIWSGTISEMDETDNPYVVQFIQGHPNGPFTSLSDLE